MKYLDFGKRITLAFGNSMIQVKPFSCVSAGSACLVVYYLENWRCLVKNKPAKKFDWVLITGYVVVVLIHLIGYLVTRTTADMSPIEVAQLGITKVVSSLIGIISIIAMFIITVIRTKNQRKCPSCGAKAQSAGDQKCQACGTLLVNN